MVSVTEPKLLMKILQVTFTGGPEDRNTVDLEFQLNISLLYCIQSMPTRKSGQCLDHNHQGKFYCTLKLLSSHHCSHLYMGKTFSSLQTAQKIKTLLL